MNFSGAGGTSGGIGRFFLGLVMMIAGGYLFLNSILVDSHFGMGARLFGIGGFSMTSGMVLIPFIFGVGLIFYNSKNMLGWGLTISSLIMLVFGVIANLSLRFDRMSAFDLLMIIALFAGGLGLFMSSLRDLK